MKQRENLAVFVVIDDAGGWSLQVEIAAIDAGVGNQIGKSAATLESRVDELRFEQDVDDLKAAGIGAVVRKSVRLVIIDRKIIALPNRYGGVIEVVNGASPGNICNFQEIVPVIGIVIHIRALNRNRLTVHKQSGSCF